MDASVSPTHHPEKASPLRTPGVRYLTLPVHWSPSLVSVKTGGRPTFNLII